MEWIKKLLESVKVEDGKVGVDGLLTQIKSEFPKHAVPKETFNDVSNQLKTANETIGTLKKEHGDVETLQTTIKTHEETIKIMKESHTKELNTMAINSAIEKALASAKAKHPELLSSKFDLEKVVVKDGVVTGVEEQLKGIKESYKDLFEEKMAGKSPELPDKGGSINKSYDDLVANADNMTAEEIATHFSALQN